MLPPSGAGPPGDAAAPLVADAARILQIRRRWIGSAAMITEEGRRVRAGAGLAGLALSVALVLLMASGASAQTNSALLAKPFPKELLVQSEAGGLVLEGGHTQKSDHDFHLGIYGTQGMFRLMPGEVASPRIGYNFLYLDTHTSLPGFPERLVDQSVAFATPIGKYEDWIFGASLGVGYAGDSFFGDGDAYYGLASLAAIRQIDDASALVFVLDYDGNRTFLPDIPIPGVEYVRRIGDTLEMTLGVPLSSVRWKPADQLTIELAYYIPYDVRLDIGYEVIPHVTLFGRTRQETEGFYVDGLGQNYYRILFEQRRAEAGLRYSPDEHLNFDVALGYAWGGEFSSGFSTRSSTREIADISDEPYIRAGLELRY
jgi:hypothetical protein